MTDTFTANKRRIRLVHDDTPSSPRENDNLAYFFCQHKRYDLGDTGLDGVQELVDTAYEEASSMQGFIDAATAAIKKAYGATVVLPLSLLDHSTLHLYTGSGAHRSDPGGWDSGMVGFAFDPAERRENVGTPPEHIEEVINGELEEYNSYVNGDTWGHVEEELVTWTAPDGRTEDRWEEVDSCWGFVGLEHAEDEAKSIVAGWEAAA